MSAEPFLKWAGGKKWLLKSHSEHIPQKFQNYYEPFVGGGAIFFGLSPTSGAIGDSNIHLVETYECMRDDWKLMLEILEHHHIHHSNEYYYLMRSEKFENKYLRAAQFIYLNRTCWNGLYRVNLKGQFNVPKGTKKNVIMPKDDFEKVSALLKNVAIIHGDFSKTISAASENDLIFIDPPYTYESTDKFVKYNDNIFTWDDQVRLRDLAFQKRSDGCKVLVTNIDHKSIRDLYENAHKIIGLRRRDTLAANGSFRGKYSEVLIII